MNLSQYLKVSICSFGRVAARCQVATHAPLLLSLPGATEPGLRTPALVEFVDIFPTLVEAAGFPALDTCPEDSHEVSSTGENHSAVTSVQVELCSEGASMMPLMSGQAEGWKEAAFFQVPRQQQHGEHIPECMGYTVRTADWRYTEWVKIDR